MRKVKVHCLRKDTNTLFLEDYNYTCIYLYIYIWMPHLYFNSKIGYTKMLTVITQNVESSVFSKSSKMFTFGIWILKS